MARPWYKRLYAGWMAFAHVLGTVNGYVLLSVFYFIVLPCYAIPYKIVMWVRSRHEQVSTWVSREQLVDDRHERARHQF